MINEVTVVYYELIKIHAKIMQTSKYFLLTERDGKPRQNPYFLTIIDHLIIPKISLINYLLRGAGHH